MAVPGSNVIDLHQYRQSRQAAAAARAPMPQACPMLWVMVWMPMPLGPMSLGLPQPFVRFG